MSFKPMLAFSKMPDLSKLRYPLAASPKLDGIRCVVRNGCAVSRTLKPIPNELIRISLEADYGDPESGSEGQLEGLDGELILEGGTFQETTSVVMSHEAPHDVVDRVTFNVFDCALNPEMPFQARYVQAATKVGSFPYKGVKLVPHTLIKNVDELHDYEQMQLAAGYEGVMLRSLDGPYKFGRSTEKEGYLLKLKRFEDAEATIVGFEQMMRNENEQTRDELGRAKRSSAKDGLVPYPALGAFILRRPDGVEFRCGSGMSDSQKAEFWVKRGKLLGAQVKFKHQPHGAKDAPRSPVFLGIRAKGDM